jgi:L1 cell adhesion molecule like protein
MVKDAERYADEDKKHMARVSAKNGLEGYCYSLKQTIDDEKVKDKISDEDKKAIEKKVKEIIQWVEGNEAAEVEEFEDKKKELESVANPIMTKMYSEGGGAGGMPGGMPGGFPGGGFGGGDDDSSSHSGPKVEEVD